jgi:spermidine synthase/MFS family permease
MSESKSSEGQERTAQLTEAIALYVIVFTCGAVLMGAEIVGSRVLNPFFGSAIFVWGSLIGIVMTALAIGYYFGGIAADKNPSFNVLCLIVAGAGFFLIIMPSFAVPLCSSIDRAFKGPRAGPMIASILLFLLPGMLLAMVSPFAVRLSAKSLTTLGNVAGRLYSLSTAGSIAGTLLTAFVLIPVMGTMKLVFSLGVVLILLAAAGFVLVWRFKKGTPITAGALLLACALVGLAAYPEGPGAEITPRYDANKPHELVYWNDSAYHLILVTEQPDYEDLLTGTVRRRRLLRFNDRVQSAIFVDPTVYDRETDTLKTFQSAVGYTDLLHLGLVFCPDAKRALFVGSGGAIGPTEFIRRYEMECEVIEIDPMVEYVARTYFHIDDRITYHIGDGRREMKYLAGGYDMIVLDAYSSGGHIPAHLTTKEFLELCRSKLAPGGVLVSNVISALRDEGCAFYQSEYLTMLEAGFANVYTFPRFPSPEEEKKHGVYRDDYWRGRSINIIMIASQDPERMSKSKIGIVARALTKREQHPVEVPNFVHYAKGLWEGTRSNETMRKDLTEGIVLTDDYCPVDTMYKE